MGKKSKENGDASVVQDESMNATTTEAPEVSWEDLVSRVGVFAKPLANKKLAKRLYKCVKKAHKHKQLRKGVREVQKFIRKGEKGLVVFAGDTSPVEVISHLPVVCEESDLPYCYTPSRQDLGSATGSERLTCMVLIKPHAEYQDIYDQCETEMRALPIPA